MVRGQGKKWPSRWLTELASCTASHLRGAQSPVTLTPSRGVCFSRRGWGGAALTVLPPLFVLVVDFLICLLGRQCCVFFLLIGRCLLPSFSLYFCWCVSLFLFSASFVTVSWLASLVLPFVLVVWSVSLLLLCFFCLVLFFILSFLLFPVVIFFDSCFFFFSLFLPSVPPPSFRYISSHLCFYFICFYLFLLFLRFNVYIFFPFCFLCLVYFSFWLVMFLFSVFFPFCSFLSFSLVCLSLVCFLLFTFCGFLPFCFLLFLFCCLFSCVLPLFYLLRFLCLLFAPVLFLWFVSSYASFCLYLVYFPSVSFFCRLACFASSPTSLLLLAVSCPFPLLCRVCSLSFLLFLFLLRWMCCVSTFATWEWLSIGGRLVGGNCLFFYSYFALTGNACVCVFVLGKHIGRREEEEEKEE